MFLYIPHRLTPDRGFCIAVCDCKVNNKFSNFNPFLLKNIFSCVKNIAIIPKS